jgi:hypothetical protein
MQRYETIQKRHALVDQLRELDRQRDALRAAIADASILCAEPSYYSTEEYKAAHTAALQARADRRAARRAWERERFGVIPPGPWDEDLDKHLGGPIEWDLGDGYSGRLIRNRDGGWNYYITVPAGHALWGKDYEHMDLPCRFTFAGPRRAEDGGGWTFGHCHDAEAGATVPRRRWNAYGESDFWNGDDRNGRQIDLATFQPVGFMTAEKVQEQVMRIKKCMMPADLLAAQEAREAAAAAAAREAREAEWAALEAKYEKDKADRKAAARAKMTWAQIAKGCGAL